METNQLLTLNALRLGAVLAEIGALCIEIEYHGGGDEGHIETNTILDSEEDPIEMAEARAARLRLLDDTGEEGGELDLESAAERLYFLTLRETGNEDYEDGEGGRGTWRVYHDGRVVLEHQDYYVTARNENHVFHPPASRIAA